MATQGQCLLAGRRLPDLHGPVVATRGDAVLVRAEGHTPDVGLVAAETTDFPARRHVPDPHGPIPSGRCETCPLGTEGQIPDKGLVTANVVDWPPGVRVPDDHK